MSLRSRQILFARLWPLLILKAFQLGYEVVLGETYRSPEETKRLADLGIGHRTSLHGECLAGHIELFRDGVYLTDSKDYRELGHWWLQQDKLCRWGGNFSKPDGHHFSVTYQGRS